MKMVGNCANVLLSLRLRKKAKIKGVIVQSVAKIIIECKKLSRESLQSKNKKKNKKNKKKQCLSVFLLFQKTWFFNFSI